ncbi:MAG TPA: MarR family transcriptional regulator [Solirubrobacterales bacterium]|nr:MarR family transcriptional regulator [Solirubrobacterales bacterium]
MATVLVGDEPKAAELAARLRLVIARTARRLRQEPGTDLSPSQSAALATIEAHGPLAPSELATLERIQRPTATRVLARLEEAGLVERAGDPTDRRVSLVSASRRGAALLRRMHGRKNAYLARRLRGLERDELRTLERAADILERLLEGEAR